MNSLVESAIEVLRGALPGLNVPERPRGAVIATVPARNEEVGDLVFSLEGDEVTVAVGDWYECQFTIDAPGGEIGEADVRRVMESVASYASDILAERAAIRVHLADGKILSSVLYFRSGGRAPPKAKDTDEVMDFVWSGPI